MITSDPPGINCPPACGPINFPDAKVMLTAVGLNGYSFSRWDGCASEDASTTPTRCEVDTTPDATTTITASFDPAAKLDVSPQGPGSVQATFDTATGEGVTSSDFSSGPGECHDFADSDGSAHCILPYLRGRVVTLTASPNTGEPFLGWGRYDCPATSLTCVITMNSAHESVAPLFGATGPCTCFWAASALSPVRLEDSRTTARVSRSHVHPPALRTMRAQPATSPHPCSRRCASR